MGSYFCCCGVREQEGREREVTEKREDNVCMCESVGLSGGFLFRLLADAYIIGHANG